MKTILCCVTNDLNFDQRMIRICSSLSQSGYAVTLLGRKKKTSRVLQQRPYKQLRFRCIFSKGKLFYLEYNFRLILFLIKSNYDIVCAVDLDTILPCLAYSRLKKKKLVYDAHEYFPEVPEVVGRPFVKRVWQWVEKVSVPQADLCYTVSYSLAKAFEEKYQRRFHVIRNVPFLRKEESNAEKGMIILYQGALNQGRALEPVIEAMQELDLELHLAGDGDLADELKQKVHELQLQDKVKFLGNIKPEELTDYTPKAWLGYNLLKNEGLSYYYSLSNKFFDYIQAGVPVLSSPFPEYCRINEEFRVAYFSEPIREKIVADVKKLLNEKERYNELRENCLKAKYVYNWEQEEQKLFTHYNDL